MRKRKTGLQMADMDLSDALASSGFYSSIHSTAPRASTVFIHFRSIIFIDFASAMKSLRRMHIQVKRIGKVGKLIQP